MSTHCRPGSLSRFLGWMLGFWLTVGLAQAQQVQLKLTYPISRMIVQRDNNNQASVQLAGSYDQPLDKVEARAVARVAGQGTTTDWSQLTTSKGQFGGTLTIKGGWYQLEVRAFKNGQQVGTDVLDRFGVGEVFAIVGHSDAQGSSCILNGTDHCPTIDGASDDRVNIVALDQSSPEFQTYLNTADTRYLPGLAFHQLSTFSGISPFAKMAWFWGHMGDVLVQRINVPVLLYNAGFGGTNMEQTYDAAYDIPFQHSFVRYDLRMPYANIRNLMNLYVPTTGLRAILLNHGVNDRASTTDDIVKWHYGVIDKVRQEFNMPNLGWIIALASFFNGRYENVRQAQYQTINRGGYQAYIGPDLDNINSLDDMPDGGHYSPSGQVKAGEAWANAITNAYLTTTIQPYPAQVQPLNAIACAGSQQLTLSAPANYAYTWNTGSADQSVTVGAGQYSVRIKASQQTVYFPPAVVVPTTINPAIYGCVPAQAPIISGQLGSMFGPVGSQLSYSVGSGVFSDPSGLSLSYSYQGLPAGLTGSGSVISGIPTSSGVGSFTVTATNSAGLSVSTSAVYNMAPIEVIPQSPVLNQQPAALAGVINVALSYNLPATTFTDPRGLLMRYNYKGLPPGLSGRDLVVEGTPTATSSGSFTITATNSSNLSTSVPVTYAITAVSQPQPPVQVSQLAALSAQAGQPVNYAVPASAFRDPGNLALTFSYRNLPAGLSGSGLTVSGTPTGASSGQFNVVVTNSAGLSVVAPVSYTITAASGGALTLIAPLYNCSTGAITFQTTGGNGTTIEFMSPGITSWSTNPNQFLDRDARTASDTPPFTLYARQSGTVVSYTWSRQAACSGISPPVSSTTVDTPPVSTTTDSTTTSTGGSGLSWLAPLYDCATGVFTFRTTGGDGSKVEYLAPGITGWTSNPKNMIDSPVRSDPPTSIVLHARQNGVEIATYSFNLKAFCSGTTPPVSATTAPTTTTAPSSGGALALIAPLYNCSTGAITFQTTGGNGSPIEFMSVGITGWSTNPNQYLDREARTDSDTPPFTLYARQSGTVVTYTWSRQASCSGSARVAAADNQSSLSVQVLGNPVEGSRVEVIVTGAADHSLTLEVVDLRGHVVHRQVIESAQAEERSQLKIGQTTGLLLLRVTTPTQQQIIKLIKQ